MVGPIQKEVYGGGLSSKRVVTLDFGVHSRFSFGGAGLASLDESTKLIPTAEGQGEGVDGRRFVWCSNLPMRFATL